MRELKEIDTIELVTSPPSGRLPRPPQACCLSVLMPVYNERNTLREIIARVRDVEIPKEIIIVDDGSRDGTIEVLRSQVEGKFPDVKVFYHEQNRGKGAAIRTAISKASGEYVVVQDADLEYDPQQLTDLLAVMQKEGAEVVYGSRFKGSVEGMRLPNLIANRILTFLANRLFDARITDEATCYKMFRREVLTGMPLRARRFDFCPEVTAKLLRRGYRIREVPIRYRARTKTEGKKIGWVDGVGAIWALIKYRFID